MLGKTTLFVPGMDHAGISTQTVVEKRLYKTMGKTRHDIGRERFLETVLDWKNEYGRYFFLIFVFSEMCLHLQLPRSNYQSASSPRGQL
jgi:hypothetical protein